MSVGLKKARRERQETTAWREQDAPLPAAIDGTAPRLPPLWTARLNSLRRMLSRSRLCADCGDWCALDQVVWGGDRSNADKIGRVFMQMLSRHAARPMTFHKVGSAQVSHDEIWLLRLVDAVRSRNNSNIEALIGFRISPRERWRMRMLAIAFIDALSGQACSRIGAPIAANEGEEP